MNRLKINRNGSFYDAAYTMQGKPPKPSFLMKVYVWSRTFVPLWLRRHKIHRVNVKGLKAPYILLANHGSRLDFNASSRALFPQSAANVGALDAYVKREYILRWLGSVGVRKFAKQESSVGRNMLHVIKKHGLTLIIYPEARYTLDGRCSVLPQTLGKLIKLADVPVVTLMNQGHHLVKPYWSPHSRFFKTASVMTQIITQEEVQNLSSDAIQNRVENAMQYDDYAWQKETGLRIKHKKRAEGLHHLLYRCSQCNDEHAMTSHGTQLLCTACHTTLTLTPSGDMQDASGKTRSIASYVDAQKEALQKDIAAQHYRMESTVDVYALPNPKGFVPCGQGHFVHDSEGYHLDFQVEGEAKTLDHHPKRQYALHVAYDHHHGQPFIGFSQDNQTYFLGFPKGYPVTKLAFATEQLYTLYNGKSAE